MYGVILGRYRRSVGCASGSYQVKGSARKTWAWMRPGRPFQKRVEFQRRRTIQEESLHSLAPRGATKLSEVTSALWLALRVPTSGRSPSCSLDTISKATAQNLATAAQETGRGSSCWSSHCSAACRDFSLVCQDAARHPPPQIPHEPQNWYGKTCHIQRGCGSGAVGTVLGSLCPRRGLSNLRLARYRPCHITKSQPLFPM